MDTRTKRGKAIIGLAMAAVMVIALVAMVPVSGHELTVKPTRKVDLTATIPTHYIGEQLLFWNGMVNVSVAWDGPYERAANTSDTRTGYTSGNLGAGDKWNTLGRAEGWYQIKSSEGWDWLYLAKHEFTLDLETTSTWPDGTIKLKLKTNNREIGTTDAGFDENTYGHMRVRVTKEGDTAPTADTGYTVAYKGTTFKAISLSLIHI